MLSDILILPVFPGIIYKPFAYLRNTSAIRRNNRNISTVSNLFIQLFHNPIDCILTYSSFPCMFLTRLILLLYLPGFNVLTFFMYVYSITFMSH